ncbi:rCG52944, isoform CRA_c [Rattus norvegicus]|uniref:RCG52944, isoform CRA_c n=1 Tax=Rattus norvegicus TaxID=10116 RepID=A6IQQ9_RAT|nr:rCG52944, isoform CRA_c [Rattus norvegicus]
MAPFCSADPNELRLFLTGSSCAVLVGTRSTRDTGGATPGPMGRFSSFLMPNVSPHSFPKGTLGKLTGLSSTEENTRKDSRKKFKRKEPAVQSSSSGPSQALLWLI